MSGLSKLPLSYMKDTRIGQERNIIVYCVVTEREVVPVLV